MPLTNSTGASRLQLSYPVRALCCYIDRTACFRTTDQLFVVFGRRGTPLSSQRHYHEVQGGIAAANEAPCCSSLARLHVHSKRGKSASAALRRGVAVSDICRAASRSSTFTFVRSPHGLATCTGILWRFLCWEETESLTSCSPTPASAHLP